MSERAVVAVLTGLAALLGPACEPKVVVGSDQLVDDPQAECGVYAPVASCPQGPRGPPVALGSSDELRQRLSGRWLFCGGTRRYTGRDPLTGFYGGEGVEFFEEGGRLRFAYLRGTTTLSRRLGGSSSGTVELALDGGQARAVLVAEDGVASTWELELFDGPKLLRNSAFEIWDFVAAP